MPVIYVTKDDIKNGIRASPNRCPVALAAKRAMPKYKRTSVGGKEITCYLPAWREFIRTLLGRRLHDTYALPLYVQRFIGDFDRSYDISQSSFSFEIRKV